MSMTSETISGRDGRFLADLSHSVIGWYDGIASESMMLFMSVFVTLSLIAMQALL